MRVMEHVDLNCPIVGDKDLVKVLNFHRCLKEGEWDSQNSHRYSTSDALYSKKLSAYMNNFYLNRITLT